MICEKIVPIDCITGLRPVTGFKSLQHSCFPVNFAKFLNLFFTEHLRTTAGFFYSFYCFLPPAGELIETSFFLFLDMFHHSFRTWLNIMNLNDLVVAAWEHAVLGDITWNLAVFCRLINVSVCTYWIFVLHCPAIIHPWNN